MWLEIVAFFLGASILLYCLLAGADFGAGILELFSSGPLREEQRELTTHAMGPVWEANHVWLIVGVVILFNGFPAAFEAISIYFHLPLIVLLLAIVLRGSAFTFRHYDAVKDRSQTYYNAVFAVSSVLASLTLGVLAGGLMLGRTNPDARDYASLYVHPWLNGFSFAVGAFTCSLFAFLAATYLVGETADTKLRQSFIRRAQAANFAAVVSGALVFLCARWENPGLWEAFRHDPWCLACLGLATVMLVPLWLALEKSRVTTTRILAGGQVTLILIGWLKTRFPVLLAIAPGSAIRDIDIWQAAAPESALRALGLALLFGSALIFPSLFYLLRVFKTSDARRH